MDYTQLSWTVDGVEHNLNPSDVSVNYSEVVLSQVQTYFSRVLTDYTANASLTIRNQVQFDAFCRETRRLARKARGRLPRKVKKAWRKAGYQTRGHFLLIPITVTAAMSYVNEETEAGADSVTAEGAELVVGSLGIPARLLLS